jgi:imidazole glycerol-phosphate synthase subunit HisH
VIIGIIDTGVGNTGSVHRMLHRLGASTADIRTLKDLQAADRLIIPGVGTFDKGVKALKSSGLFDPIIQKVSNGTTPILGICLGMHLLCQTSEEGNERGLGLIDALVERFQFPKNPLLKVPHMGWNTVTTMKRNPLLLADGLEQRFYFVHSYKVTPKNKNVIIGKTFYGTEFCSAFSQRNVFGVQFHPEKSHRFGLTLLKNFLEL